MINLLHTELQNESDKSLAFWSGNTIYYNGVFYLFYTRGSNELSIHNGDQRIHFATSKDGHNFVFQQEILNSDTVKGKKFGIQTYDFDFTQTKKGFLIPALRDPHIISLKGTSLTNKYKWMMFFAANTKSLSGEILHGVGRAVSSDLLSWDLISPMELNKLESNIQLELPNLTSIQDENGDNGFLFMASIRKNGKPNLQFWYSKDIQGPWAFIDYKNDKPLDNLYGFNFVKSSQGNTFLVSFDEKSMQVQNKYLKVILRNNEVILVSSEVF